MRKPPAPGTVLAAAVRARSDLLSTDTANGPSLGQPLCGARTMIGPWLPRTRRDVSFPQANCLYKEGQRPACPEQIEKKPARLCYLCNSTSWKAGWLRFQTSTLAQHAEKPETGLRRTGLPSATVAASENG